MPAAPVAVVDALNGLLESEQSSLFRYMGAGSPYLSRADADVRRPLADMVDANARHVAELATLIESLGGYPTPRASRGEEQYLAYLSIKFLLPKLVEEKRLTIQRYENTIKAIEKAPTPTPEALAVLTEHLAENHSHLTTLERAAASVLMSKS